MAKDKASSVSIGAGQSQLHGSGAASGFGGSTLSSMPSRESLSSAGGGGGAGSAAGGSLLRSPSLTSIQSDDSASVGNRRMLFETHSGEPPQSSQSPTLPGRPPLLVANQRMVPPAMPPRQSLAQPQASAGASPALSAGPIGYGVLHGGLAGSSASSSASSSPARSKPIGGAALPQPIGYGVIPEVATADQRQQIVDKPAGSFKRPPPPQNRKLPSPPSGSPAGSPSGPVWTAAKPSEIKAASPSVGSSAAKPMAISGSGPAPATGASAAHSAPSRPMKPSELRAGTSAPAMPLASQPSFGARTPLYTTAPVGVKPFEIPVPGGASSAAADSGERPEHTLKPSELKALGMSPFERASVTASSGVGSSPSTKPAPAAPAAMPSPATMPAKPAVNPLTKPQIPPKTLPAPPQPQEPKVETAAGGSIAARMAALGASTGQALQPQISGDAERAKPAPPSIPSKATKPSELRSAAQASIGAGLTSGGSVAAAASAFGARPSAATIADTSNPFAADSFDDALARGSVASATTSAPHTRQGSLNNATAAPALAAAAQFKPAPPRLPSRANSTAAASAVGAPSKPAPPPMPARSSTAAGTSPASASAPRRPIPDAAFNRYAQLHADLVGARTGLLAGHLVKKVWVQSNLSRIHLASIWMLVDTHRRGALSVNQFAIGMFLIDDLLAGNPAVSALPANVVAFCSA
nr:hypothetical protein HK105_006068 [Polyrhizophydium stewartii]